MCLLQKGSNKVVCKLKNGKMRKFSLNVTCLFNLIAVTAVTMVVMVMMVVAVTVAIMMVVMTISIIAWWIVRTVVVGAWNKACVVAGGVSVHVWIGARVAELVVVVSWVVTHIACLNLIRFMVKYSKFRLLL
jgi:hypothetical protein